MSVLSLGLTVADLPARSVRLQTLCMASICRDQLSAEGVQSLHELGLNLGDYAAYVIGLHVVFTLSYCFAGALIFWRRSDERIALFIAFFLVTFGAGLPLTFEALTPGSSGWDLSIKVLVLLGWVLFFVFFYLFPDGRFVPLWTRWLAAVWVAREIARYFFPDSPFSPWSWPPLLTLLEALVSAGTCIFAQIYRYRRVSGPVERQQTKWVIFGMTLAVVGFFVFAVPNVFLSTSSRIGSSYYLISLAVMYLSFLLIPLSLIVAILRYRLWEIDVLINRTLVYGILTVTLALVYLGSIVLLQQGFRTFAGQENQLAVVASTLAIASLFNPLRHRLQEFIDRRFYRRKYDAAKTLEAFNAKLRNETSLVTLSNHVLTVVNETMQPTHVSLWLPPSQEVTSEDKALSEEAQ